MSEQDKEMEADMKKEHREARENYGYTRGPAAEAFDLGFESGWKAASERKDLEIDRKIEEAMKRAEVDVRLRTYDGEIQSLQSKLATALAALEWYANDGHTGRPILAGNVAREAIALIKGEKC